MKSVVYILGKIFGFISLCVLFLSVLVCTFIVWASSALLGLISGILLPLGLLVLVLDSWKTGLQMLAAAFLLSQYGLPMTAAYLLGKLMGAVADLKDFVFD